jgi:hypothetical protein
MRFPAKPPGAAGTLPSRRPKAAAAALPRSLCPVHSHGAREGCLLVTAGWEEPRPGSEDGDGRSRPASARE